MAISFSRTTRALEQDTFGVALLLWLLGGVLLAAWMAWFLWASVTVFAVSAVARLEVVRSSSPITVMTAGKILSSKLALGQEVNVGEVLLTLDATSDQMRLQEERARQQALPTQINALQKQIIALEQAKSVAQQAQLASVQSAKSRQSEAYSAFTFAEDHARRLAELSAQGQMPLMDSLKAQTEMQKLLANKNALTADMQRVQKTAETQLHQQQADIEHLKSEIAKLQGELNSSLSASVRLQQTIDNHQVRAPIAGRIGDALPLQVGTYVNLGDKLGAIIPDGELRIVADFPPAAVIGKIHPGQSATMRLDGFPWAQYGVVPAVVSQVGAEIRNAQVRVEFTPQLPSAAALQLQHGLPGSIAVQIEQVSPAILVLRASGQLLSNHLSTGLAR